MQRVGNIAAVALALCCSGICGAEERTFSDKFGREIEAQIESVRPPNVVLKRSDGKSFVLPIDKLSEADQAFVAKWREENPEIKLRYRFDKEKKSSEGDAERRDEEWAYKVTINNGGHQDLEGLEVEYTIYKQLNDRYAKVRRRISGQAAGTAKIAKVERQRSASFETNTIATGKVNKVTKTRNGDGQFTDSTFEKWDEDICGIRMTVTYRERVVDSHEFGTVPEGSEPIGEVEKGQRTSRSRNF